MTNEFKMVDNRDINAPKICPRCHSPVYTDTKPQRPHNYVDIPPKPDAGQSPESWNSPLKYPLTPRPKKPKKLTKEDEEFERFEQKYGLAEFGTTGKSLRGLYASIISNANGLFKALSLDDIPSKEEDFIVNYMRPTREFRRSLALELTERQRTMIHNYLSYTIDMAEDMIEMIREIDEKK
jgi:hypothetical protein